jgi:very-short-patch-repair endonuclease
MGGGGMDLGGMLGGLEGGGAPMGGMAPPAAGGMGGEMPVGGEMAGGAGSAGGAGAPALGGTAMAAQQVSPTPVFIGKRGSKKPEQQQPPPIQTKTIELTKLEQKMLRILTGMSNQIPYGLYGQYQLRLPGQPQAFLADFAYPAIGVIVEADGEQWHEELESKARDIQRDQKLANVGWRVLRFKEEAINNHADEVAKIIYSNVVEAAKEKAQRIKTASTDQQINKIAEQLKDFENINKEKIVYDRKEIISDGLDMGCIYYIGIE